MSSQSFENYARLASDQHVENTELSGRYAFQGNDEKRIVPDVSAKLDIREDDTLLEIGSGPGNLLIPLSHIVRLAAAIDSAPVLDRMLSRRDGKSRIETYPGNFLSIELPPLRFSKVLIYSVFHYLDSHEMALSFLERALSLLQPGGRLLVGDLPNSDKKARFLQTDLGEKMSAEWAELVSGTEAHPLSTLATDEQLITVDDAFVMRLMVFGRERGLETYLLPQQPNLPFCYSREDILFVAPE